PDANIIFGAVIDEALGDEIRITVVATGFDQVREDSLEVAEQSQPQAVPVHAQQKQAFLPPEPPPPLPEFDLDDRQSPFVAVGSPQRRLHEIGAGFATDRQTRPDGPKPWLSGGRSVSDLSGSKRPVTRTNPFSSGDSEFGANGYPRKR
ncbi:MAG TPA: hypothetical protein PK095_08705, partial [Myxococcota bacterium]|nr:hypothetical protein [Myxococcota bacterium]